MFLKVVVAVSAAWVMAAGPVRADEIPAADRQSEQVEMVQSSLGQVPGQSAEAQDAVPADNAAMSDIQARFEARFPGVTVSEVRATPFAGLYEIRIGRDLLYANADVDYVMQGALVDAANRKDLTAQRLEELSRVSFDDLPLQLAIRQVYGKGTHRIAVFEDPNCGYCKRFHQTLKAVADTTVYTFLFPILSDDSTVKARNIWCAKNQAEVWMDWMHDGKTPPQATCDMPLDDLMTLGRELMVTGTPAIVFADGSRVNGAIGADALKQKLAEVAQSL